MPSCIERRTDNNDIMIFSNFPEEVLVERKAGQFQL